MFQTIRVTSLFCQPFRHYVTTKEFRKAQSLLKQDIEKLEKLKLRSVRNSRHRVYVWGLAATGALGVHQDISKLKRRNSHIVHHPTRQSFAERHDVIDVACGYGFTLFATKPDENGTTVFGTGLNTDSQLGFHKLGGSLHTPMTQIIYPAPIQLPRASSNAELCEITSIAAGRAHSVLLSSEGIVYTLGNNSFGQCGRMIVQDEEYGASHIINRLNKTAFGCDDRVENAVCGQDHSLFLMESGRIYACGWGADGQTGVGHYDCVDVPTLVGGDVTGEKIVKIASSMDCVLAINGNEMNFVKCTAAHFIEMDLFFLLISENGEVFGWGNSEYGQLLSNSDQQQIHTPMHLHMTKKCGKIVDIAAGGSFCLILNGMYIAYNPLLIILQYLSIPTIHIEIKLYFLIFIEHGNVFVWGYGLLGLGPIVEYVRTPTVIPHTLFGCNELNPKSKVTSISCGANYMAAINDQNDLFIWGKNKFGALGLGHENDQYFPLKVSIGAQPLKLCCGFDHSVAYCKPFL